MKSLFDDNSPDHMEILRMEDGVIDTRTSSFSTKITTSCREF
jgi:hypothetical protein